MKADRNSCFSPAKALSLALSASFICASVVVANPSSDKTDSQVKPTATVSKDKSAAASDTAIKSTKDQAAPAVEAEQKTKTEAAETTADAAKQSEKSDSVQGKESAATTDDTKDKDGEAAKAAQEGPTPEELQILGMQHWSLSKKYVKDWDLDLAETELDLSIMDSPDLKVAHRDLCLVSLLKFNVFRSLAEFMMTIGLGEAIPMNDEEASKLIEDGMVKHYKKGLSFARKQEWKPTLFELELAEHLVPDDYAVQRSLAFAYANTGNFEKAEQHYKKTFELAPHDGSSRADLAYFLAANGKVGEAQKEMEEAVKSAPKAAAYHVDLSFMAEKSGDLNLASKELKEAVTLSPQHANLWEHLGQVCERQGDTQQAVEAYSHAVALDPQLADAKQRLEKLQANLAPQQAVEHSKS
ncbi:MAG: tetratricopeptide repeat protein [Candidatus Obscuribacterales bacterium]|nr:tetratricopeptide repeat protein [Candidatus Obscuribacterales bacterium]